MPEASTLMRLKQQGQRVWLNHIERRILTNGVLRQIIAHDGLSGLTFNPAIFARAIAHTDDYTRAINEMIRRHASAEQIYERLAIYDIKRAADIFHREFDRSGGEEGYVSVELSPRLAYDTRATVAEAARLWRLLERPNVMIKVPATHAGLSAIRQLTRDGINVDATLLFSAGRYVDVINAYMSGLEDRIRDGQAVDGIFSVASFFVSPIDAGVDAALDRIAVESVPHIAQRARELKGRAAVASAGMAWRRFGEHFVGPRWLAIERHGARKQRLVWTNTAAKNPANDDIKYVEALIGPQTITTLTLPTLGAFRDHGDAQPHLDEAAAGAADVVRRLLGLNVALVEIVNTLEVEGVEKSVRDFDRLLGTIDAFRGYHIARTA